MNHAKFLRSLVVELSVPSRHLALGVLLLLVAVAANSAKAAGVQGKVRVYNSTSKRILIQVHASKPGAPVSQQILSPGASWIFPVSLASVNSEMASVNATNLTNNLTGTKSFSMKKQSLIDATIKLNPSGRPVVN